MSVDAAWLAANLVAAPPLAGDRLAIVKQVFRPTVPVNADAAPARQQEPHVPVEPSEGGISVPS